MTNTFKCDQPETVYSNKEEEQLFHKFCTFISLHKGLKFGYVNIFLSVMRNKFERNLFKTFLSLDTDYEAVQTFIKYAPVVSKSKFVTKHVNKGNFLNK